MNITLRVNVGLSAKVPSEASSEVLLHTYPETSFNTPPETSAKILP